MVIFDFMDKEAFVPGKVSEQTKKIQDSAKTAGEPMKTGFDTGTLGAGLDEAGYFLKEVLWPDEIEKCYFMDRTDGYHAADHIHFACVVVK